MKEFLEYFVLKWSYFQLLLIFSSVLYLIYNTRKQILSSIISHKKIYYLLLIIFVFGTTLRFYFINSFVHVNSNDSLEYYIESAGILLDNKFIMMCDPPSYAVLLSLFQRLFGFSYIAQSFISAVFGSLTILLLFTFTQLLFKNHKVSLIASALLSFYPFHIGASVAGYPISSSIFFSILFFIFLIVAVNTNSFIYYFSAAVCISFTALFLYVEIILLFFAFIYIFSVKGIRHIFSPNIIAAFFITLLFMSPFIALQDMTDSRCVSFRQYEEQFGHNILCKFAKNYCRLFNPTYLFKNSNQQQSFVNNVDGHLPSYLSFLFLGYGTRNDYLNLSYWQKKYLSNDFDFIYLIYLLLIIFVILYSSKLKTQIIFLSLVLLSYLLIFSMYLETSHYLILPVIVYAIFPLISLGIVSLSNSLLKKSNIFILIIIIILISPFFYNRYYISLDKSAHLNKGELSFVKWDNICISMYAEYRQSCNFVINDYINKNNIKEHYAQPKE